MRISDLIQAFPVFITGMILVTLAGPQQHDNRADARVSLHADLRAAHALGGAVAAPPRFRRCGARARQAEIVHRAAPRAAERDGARADPGVGDDRLRDPDDGGLELRRRGRAPADARMGPDDRGERERTDSRRMVVLDVSRTRDLGHGVRLCGLRQRAGAQHMAANATPVLEVPRPDRRRMAAGPRSRISR